MPWPVLSRARSNACWIASLSSARPSDGDLTFGCGMHVGVPADACSCLLSEVRASNLSGDCHWVNEMFRGYAFAGFANGHQKCVRRRAELSTAMNPRCADAE